MMTLEKELEQISQENYHRSCDEILSHDEIKSKHQDGQVSIMADLNIATRVCGLDRRIPTAIRVRQQLLTWSCVLLLIGSPVSLLFVKWYWALALLLCYLPLVLVTRHKASRSIVKAALNDGDFYYDMLAMKALHITVKPK